MTALNDSTFDRLPPNDIETENAVLAAAMVSQNAAHVVSEELTADDFLRPANRSIFAAVDRLVAKNETVNALSVRAEMERERVGNEAVPDGIYLHSLIERLPIGYSAAFFAKRLRGLRLLRGLAMAGVDISALGHNTPVEDVDHAVEVANKLLDEATKATASSTAAPISELITPFLDSLEAGEDVRGVPTGWADVDDVLLRLRPGQLIVIGARPGMGKSNALLHMAHHVGVKLGEPAWFGTMEMSKEECIARLVAKDAQVDLKKIIKKELSEADWEKIRPVHDRLVNTETLVIDDAAGMGVGHIRAALRAQRRTGRPFAFAAVDYLQLLQSPGRVESRQVEVSGFSRSLKLLAKEFELPIAVGSQLNREVEHRADKRPGLADLRESGSVEQDADVVAMLYRDDYYDPESPDAGEVEFNIEKNRQGQKARVKLAFRGHYARIDDLARAPWSPTAGMS